MYVCNQIRWTLEVGVQIWAGVLGYFHGWSSSRSQCLYRDFQVRCPPPVCVCVKIWKFICTNITITQAKIPYVWLLLLVCGLGFKRLRTMDLKILVVGMHESCSICWNTSPIKRISARSVCVQMFSGVYCIGLFSWLIQHLSYWVMVVWCHVSCMLI